MRRHRKDSTTPECSSEGEGEEERRPVKKSKRSSRRDDRSPRKSHSTDRPRSSRHLVEEHRRPTRNRSRSPPHSRREVRDESRSRSRSRSRSSTPARYEAHLRSLGIFGRPPSARHGEYDGSSRGDYRHHPHHPHYGPFRGRGRGRGSYRPGYMRNMFEDGRDDPRPSHCLGVFGMPPWVREDDMRGMFEPFGEVSQLNVVMNRETGQCRGYGFVYFTTVEEAKKARSALHDAKIDGIPIRVDYSLTEKGRPSYRDNP